MKKGIAFQAVPHFHYNTNLFIHLILKPQIIGNHRNKLAIGGLASVILDGISKITVQRIHVASVPRDLYLLPYLLGLTLDIYWCHDYNAEVG